MTNQYMWHKLSEKEVRSLSAMKNFLCEEDCNVFAYLPFSYKHDGLRKAFDGLWTLRIERNNQSFGFLYSDFKILGGSFGTNNSDRMVNYLNELNSKSIKLFASFSTIGVRVMEGRKVFPHAFKIIPALVKYTKNNLLITSLHGKCLGLGALLYTVGHYRYALKSSSQINLTGPEVFRMFFGESVNFDEKFNSERMRDITNLVHEVIEDPVVLSQRALSLLLNKSLEQESKYDSYEKTHEFLEKYFRKTMRLFPQKKTSVLSFIAEKNGVKVGVLINPVGKGNMITLKTIDVYKDSLLIFKTLNLPVISFVDTPGADPGIQSTEGGLIQNLAALTVDIIDYPFKKVGVIMGRCYGGATVLSFPSIYGGEKALAMKGSHLGIMGKKIIRELLSKSPRLLAMWEINSCTEDTLQDLIDMELVEGEYDELSLSLKLDLFLLENTLMETNKGSAHYEKTS